MGDKLLPRTVYRMCVHGALLVGSQGREDPLGALLVPLAGLLREGRHEEVHTPPQDRFQG